MPPVISPLSHRRVDLAPAVAGMIEAVAPYSFAAELGLQKGDRIVAVDGRPLVDAIEFLTLTQQPEIRLEVESNGLRLIHRLQLEGDEFWGLTFSDPTFDGVLLCENACPFCFIKQIPRGMRKSLYVMDDDYRYSMLYGSFVTLTNLTEADWERIETERLGPLHVSVHATNPELRTALVGNPKAANIMADLQRLEDAGIDFHAQLVLCPNVNDGDEMDRSLADLATFSRCLSVAGVPVGLTKYGLERQSKQVRLSRTCMRLLPHRQITVRRYESAEAREVIDQATGWQQRFRAEKGRTFFHLGDEFYLMCGEDVPTAGVYDGYPQIEDGIGITRHLLEDLQRYLNRSKPGGLAGMTGTVACGELIGGTMRRAIAQLNDHTGSDLDLKVIENRFFGREINVSGLLTGGDLLSALEGSQDCSPLYISSRMISDRTHTMLDDMTVQQAARLLGRPLVPCLTLSDLARDLKRRSRRKAA